MVSMLAQEGKDTLYQGPGVLIWSSACHGVMAHAGAIHTAEASRTREQVQLHASEIALSQIQWWLWLGCPRQMHSFQWPRLG